MQNYWQIYALGSAFFAGLTAILAKIGAAGVSSNAAAFIRTIVICLFRDYGLRRAEWTSPFTLNSKSLIFLVLSGLIARNFTEISCRKTPSNPEKIRNN